MTISWLSNRLHKVYDEREARSVVGLLLEKRFGLSRVDVALGALCNLDDEQQVELEALMLRLEVGEPVQYVIGRTDFFGREFLVRPGVLVPRPETEELVAWVLEKRDGLMTSLEKPRTQGLAGFDWQASHGLPAFLGDTSHGLDILDVGTGSGCLAVTLALELDCEVTAWDISDEAMAVAMENAERLGAKMNVVKMDALNAPFGDAEKWDVIVSNPPYICDKEMVDMERNVLDYEPHIALFVPDTDPLLFYRSIAEYGTHALRKGGMLFFEINAAYGNETAEMLKGLGYSDVEVRQDCFGKDRMVTAVWVV